MSLLYFCVIKYFTRVEVAHVFSISNNYKSLEGGGSF